MKTNLKALKAFYKQNGFTLIELIVVLSIAAVITYGALSGGIIGSSKNNALSLIKDVQLLQKGTQGMYNGQGNYTVGSLNQQLITASQIPGDLPVSGTTISTQSGGVVTITGATTNFSISVTNVSSDVCTAALQQLSSGWSSVKVGASTPITTFPITPAVATSATECGAGNNLTIVWTSAS